MREFFRAWWDGITDCWTLYGVLTLVLIPILPFMILYDMIDRWRNTPTREDVLCAISPEAHVMMPPPYIPTAYGLDVLLQLKEEGLAVFKYGRWSTTPEGDRLVSEWISDE